MQTEIISAEFPNAIQQALDVLQNGGLVAFPTDTVYGLAAPVLSVPSIERLYVVKGRSSTKAIAVLLGTPDDLSQVAAEVDAQTRKIAQAFWRDNPPRCMTVAIARGVAKAKRETEGYDRFKARYVIS